MYVWSKNDDLIAELLTDERYRVTARGEILKNGKPVGRRDKEGYLEVYYKGKRLKGHRIVHAAHVGKLDCKKVVHHVDACTSNNVMSNLKLVDQKKNVEYSIRRKERLRK